MTAARDTFLNTYEPGDFLDLNVQDSLTEFANASLDSINISGMIFPLNEITECLLRGRAFLECETDSLQNTSF